MEVERKKNFSLSLSLTQRGERREKKGTRPRLLSTYAEHPNKPSLCGTEPKEEEEGEWWWGGWEREEARKEERKTRKISVKTRREKWSFCLSFSPRRSRFPSFLFPPAQQSAPSKPRTFFLKRPLLLLHFPLEPIAEFDESRENLFFNISKWKFRRESKSAVCCLLATQAFPSG